MKTWLKIGVRNLFKNKRRALSTMAAVSIGYAAANVFGGFAHYMFQGIEDAYIYSQANGHLAIYKKGFLKEGTTDLASYMLTEEDVRAILELCRSMPAVLVATPRLFVNGLISNGEVSTVFLATGHIPSDTRRIREALKSALTLGKNYQGADLDDSMPRGVGVSRGLAERLGLKIGDKAQVLAQTLEGQMNALDVDVRSVFDAQAELLNDKMLNVPLALAQKLYDAPGADRVVILLRDGRQMGDAQARLQQACRRRGLAMDVRNWIEIDPNCANAGRMLRIVFGFIFAIVCVIVTLTVINTVSMAVFERIREIGTLRALGLRQRGVNALFAIESALIGLFGSLGGGVLTLLVWAGVRIGKPMWTPPSMPQPVPLEVHLVPAYLLGTMAFLIVLAVLAAIFPSRRAARMSIVDALGHV